VHRGRASGRVALDRELPMSGRGRRLALRLAIVVLAGGLLAYGLLARGARSEHAPPLPRSRLQGPRVTLAALRGHPDAIVFYASWFDPCRAEAPAVARFARSATGRGKVLAVDTTDYGDVRAFARRYHWTFPILSDPDGATGDAWGIANGLPQWVFLNPRGEIVKRLSGAQGVASLVAALRAAAS
jgi:cytochrome c biogenesis protein CcmG, thiol:disulfide interchange protein DsbE